MAITLRMTGTITARGPIMITRPDQGTECLTMNVVRNQATVQAHAIPGSTLKGLLRAAAFDVCVDAARALGPVRVSLERLYLQTKGGVGFTGNDVDLGADLALRAREPLLSLFGSASPKLGGTLVAQHAIAEPTLEGGGAVGMGMPGGARRDPVLASPELADVLDEGERLLWGRQSVVAGDRSEAKQRLSETKRALARGHARSVPEEDIKRLKDAHDAAVKAVDAIEAAPDFKHSVQRPLPPQAAAPAGTTYEHRMELIDASPVETGLLFAAFDLWNQLPRIGGGRSTGYGGVLVEYVIEVLEGAALRRDRKWSPAGMITVGGAADRAVESTHPVVCGAMAAWRETEGRIRDVTGIFS